jgi:hypothetical protein
MCRKIFKKQKIRNKTEKTAFRLISMRMDQTRLIIKKTIYNHNISTL